LGGGGISCEESKPTITSNTISGNSTTKKGGGIECYYSSPTISNNTISGNSATDGGGIFCVDSSPTITNTIVSYSPAGGGIYAAGGSVPQVSYCDVFGNAGGDYVGMDDPTGSNGNISEAPLFGDPGSGDYHLKSTVGRWNPSTETWVTDAVDSPCIDAGDPSSDYSNEPDPNGGRVNMGAYGNTGEASKAGGGVVRPATPTDLTATLAGPTQVDLTWTDNADNEDGYTLQRRQQSGDGSWPATWTTLRWLGPNVTSFTDEEIPEDGQYQYRVRGYNAAGPGNWAHPARIVVCSTKPPTPTDFAAGLVDDNTGRLTWTDNSDINEGFTVQRRQWVSGTGWPAAWTTLRWLGPNVETYDDTINEDGVYQYRVRAYNSVGPGNWARPCCVTRATAAPDAPSDLALTAVAGGIRADWTANATNAQGGELH